MHCTLQYSETKSQLSFLPIPQIVSLGAGFDSLYFRLHGEGALQKLVVFELDVPDVARRKAALIKADICLKEGLEFPSAGLAGRSLQHTHTEYMCHNATDPHTYSTR